jgi:hypothetical protein
MGNTYDMCNVECYSWEGSLDGMPWENAYDLSDEITPDSVDDVGETPDYEELGGVRCV